MKENIDSRLIRYTDLTNNIKTISMKDIRKTARKNNNYDYRTGDLVDHKKWGRGRIVNMVEKSEDIIVNIFFDSVGNKRLSLKYSPIRPVKEE